METNMSSGEVLTANQGLSEMTTVSLPVVASLWVRKAVRLLSDIADDIEKERIILIKKWAKIDLDGELLRDEHGNAIFDESDPARFQGYMNGYEELQAVLHNVPLRQLKASELGKDTNIKPVILLRLGPLLNEEE